jgi:hypothetical protein
VAHIYKKNKEQRKSGGVYKEGSLCVWVLVRSRQPKPSKKEKRKIANIGTKKIKTQGSQGWLAYHLLVAFCPSKILRSSGGKGKRRK